MAVNQNKIEEVSMALLSLTMSTDKLETRAWKGMSWDVLDALYKRGWIYDPKGKAKSVVISPEGIAAAEEMFKKHFEEAD